MKTFTRSIETARPPAEAVRELLEGDAFVNSEFGVVARLGSHGYRPLSQTETVLNFNRTYRRWYIWLLGTPFLINALLSAFVIGPFGVGAALDDGTSVLAAMGIWLFFLVQALIPAVVAYFILRLTRTAPLVISAEPRDAGATVEIVGEGSEGTLKAFEPVRL